MPPVLMIVKFAVPPDNLARPRTLSEQAPWPEIWLEIWLEIQAQEEKIGWPLISRHSCRGLPIGYPSSQDAGLIATRELSVGEPIPIVQRAQSFVMAWRRSVTSSTP